MTRRYSLFEDEIEGTENNSSVQESSNASTLQPEEEEFGKHRSKEVSGNTGESIQATDFTTNDTLVTEETIGVVLPEGQAENPARVDTERLTVHLPITLIDRIRGAVAGTPGMTLARLAAESFMARIEEMEQERAGPFKPHPMRLKCGRPRQKQRPTSAPQEG